MLIIHKSADQNYRTTSRRGEEENPRSSSCMWAGRSDFLDFLFLFHQGKRTERRVVTPKKRKLELQIGTGRQRDSKLLDRRFFRKCREGKFIDFSSQLNRAKDTVIIKANSLSTGYIKIKMKKITYQTACCK